MLYSHFKSVREALWAPPRESLLHMYSRFSEHAEMGSRPVMKDYRQGNGKNRQY